MIIDNKHMPTSINNSSEITENNIIDYNSIRVDINSIRDEDKTMNPDFPEEPKYNANVFEWMKYTMELKNVKQNYRREIEYLVKKIETIKSKSENLEKKIKEMKKMNKKGGLIETLKNMINDKEAKFKERLKELNDEVY